MSGNTPHDELPLSEEERRKDPLHGERPVERPTEPAPHASAAATRQGPPNRRVNTILVTSAVLAAAALLLLWLLYAFVFT